MSSSNVLRFATRIASPWPTAEDRNAIISATTSMSRRMGVDFIPSDSGIVASVGLGSGDDRSQDNAYGLARVTGGIELVDLSTWGVIGTFPALRDALQAMRSHYEASR